MNRAAPKMNRIIFEREKIREHELHYNRLKNIKSSIDNRRPRKHRHLKVRGGK